MFHEHFEASSIALGNLAHLASKLVLLLGEVIGERAGILTIAPFDVVGDVPSAFELRGDLLCFVIDCPHPWSGFAFEYDVGPMRRVMAVGDDHSLFVLVSPVGLDLMMEICRDDVLLADLAASGGVDLNALPDSFWIGIEIVRFG